MNDDLDVIAAADANDAFAAQLREAEPALVAAVERTIAHLSEQLGESAEAWRGAMLVASKVGVTAGMDLARGYTPLGAVITALVALLGETPGGRAAFLAGPEPQR